ncbi:MAG: hypothetical protein HZC54_13595 [Verrucomicrobia bacterium]|nr:hypothetical protein [Verrucomicrobiota bacterium]
MKLTSPYSEAGARIGSAIKVCLEQYPSLRVGGSWASGEPHLPAVCGGWIHSLSDIDLVLVNDLAVSERGGIISHIQGEAKQARVRLAGISMKKQHGVTDSLHPAEVRPTDENNRCQLDPVYYLHFWSAISSFECSIRERRFGMENRRCVASYSASKFFFTLLRNIGVLRGHRFQSYAALSRWAKALWTELPVCEAYDIKVGNIPELSDVVVEGLIGKDTVRLVLDNEKMSGAIPGVTSLAADVLGSLYGSESLCPTQYLQAARNAVYARHLSAFVDYVESKLVRPNALI